MERPPVQRFFWEGLWLNYVFDGNVDVAFGCLAWHFICCSSCHHIGLIFGSRKHRKKWQKMKRKFIAFFCYFANLVSGSLRKQIGPRSGLRSSMNPIKNLQNIWIFCQTQPHGFDFHSHQFLKKYVCKGISYHSGHRPIVGRCRTRVESEESVLCMWGSMLMKRIHPGFETQCRHHQKSNNRVPDSPRKGLMCCKN